MRSCSDTDVDPLLLWKFLWNYLKPVLRQQNLHQDLQICYFHLYRSIDLVLTTPVACAPFANSHV